MGKLTSLKPSLGALGSALGYGEAVEPERRHPGAPPPWWKAWYKTARWRKLRAAVLLRDSYTCKMCGRLQGNTALLVCDHVRPHRGDPNRFWDEWNLQTLCADPCHNKHKQSQEAAMPKGTWD